jgi:hypothetical protein
MATIISLYNCSTKQIDCKIIYTILILLENEHNVYYTYFARIAQQMSIE